MTKAKAAYSNQRPSMENLEPVPSSDTEQFRLLLEASPDGFMILRAIQNEAGAIADFSIEYVNPAATQGLHQTPENFLGQSLQQLFPNYQTSDLFNRYVAVANSGTSDTFEAYYNHTDRSGWFRHVVTKLNHGIGVSFSDITKRKRFEDERKRVEQRRDTQYAIARILAEAITVEAATPAILNALCTNLNWQVGILWQVDPSQTVLRPVHCWQASDTNIQAFIESNQQATFAQGIGLPGRVWATRQPIWLTELSSDPNFPRAVSAGQVGLQSGFGFPILLGDEILGVIECFSLHTQEPDTDLLNLMAAIGSQIGQFMERRRTETALRESQELFQIFMDHSPIAAFIKDASGKHLYVNSLAEQIMQRSHDEIIGKTNFDLFPPDVAQLIQANDIAALNSEQGTQTLESLNLKDGQHDYMAFKFPLHNALGEKLLAGVVVDITAQQTALRDRLQAEQELRQREAELRLITNTVPVLISFVDAEQRYRFNNQKYEEWFGKPASEVYGKYLWEVLGDKAYEKIRPYVEQVLAGHEVTFETQFSIKGTGTRFIQATYVPRLSPQGTVAGFVALVDDISQRKQAEQTRKQNEERLSIAQQAAHAGLWDWDIETNRVTWSEEYYRLYGLDPASTQPSYENWLASIAEADREQVDRIARVALEHRIDLNVEFRILHPTQGERWLTAIGKTFYDDNKHPLRMTGLALDITDRKRAEEALRVSEERYRTIFDQAIVGIAQTNLTGQFIEVNERYCEIVGRSREDLLSLRMQSITYPDDLLHNVVLFQRMLTEGTSFEIEKRYLRPDNSQVWVRNHVSLIRDGDGQPQCVVAITEDITERRRIELSLRESEARFQSIVRNVPGMIYRYAPQANASEAFTYVSSGSRELLGLEPTVLLQDANRLWERIHPEDMASLQASITIAMENLAHWEWEGRLITPSGQIKWIQGKSRPEQTELGMVWDGLLIDITDLKQAEAALRQSEERYRYLAESIPQLVWTANAEGMLIDINQRWSTFTGSTLAQVQKAGWASVVHPEDLPVLERNWAEAQKNSSNYQAEGRMRRVDGVYRWHLHQAMSLKDEQGQVIKWFGTATDIEDQKQLERERIRLLQQEQAAREQAEAANRIKDEFLAVLSHELRSPLNPILGWAKILRSRKLDATTVDRALETIERNASLQTQLIGDLLDVSRILQGKLSLDIAPVNLANTITAAIETVRLAAEAKAIDVQFAVLGSTGSWERNYLDENPLSSSSIHVMGDAARLQQIIWNLLSNAVKFTSIGGRVEVELQRSEFSVISSQIEDATQPTYPPRGYAQITVTDTGKGIDPDFLPYVFDYFRQADGATTRKFGGLGLGLAIVRHLVELHGGTVEATSPGEGQGATFTVRLPLMQSSRFNNQVSKIDLVDETTAFPLRGAQILLVDDEPDTRDYLAFVLEQAGAMVKIATSAQEALQKLARLLPQLLLSDIGMPDMDGYMLIRQVRQLPPDRGGMIPAIALTAYAGELNQQQAIAAGFQLHLPKPVEPGDLVKAIASLLSQDLSSQ